MSLDGFVGPFHTVSKYVRFRSPSGKFELEKAAQGKCCPVRSIGLRANSWTLRSDLLERADTAVTKLQISPLIVNGFKNGFHQWIQRIFLVVVQAERNLFLSEIFFLFSKYGCTLLYRL